MSKKLALAAAATGLLVATAAQALPTYSGGSFAFVAGTKTTTAVATTTTFPLSTPTLSVSDAGDFTLGGAPAIPFPLSLTSPLIFTSAGKASFNFSDASLGTFVADVSLTALGGPVNTAAYDIEGHFTLGSGWANAGKVISANEIWSLTQAGGPGKSISLSGTFNAPAAPGEVPEPLTVSLLGFGLAGLGSLRRKKSA